MDEERYDQLYNRILDGDNWDYSTLDELICLSESGAREEGRKDMKQKAIEAFKENCQRPKDTEPCECKLCVRWVGGHCELLDGFIEKLNS